MCGQRMKGRVRVSREENVSEKEKRKKKRLKSIDYYVEIGYENCKNVDK